MLTDTPPEKKPIFKNPFLYSSLAIGIAALVVAWIFFSRTMENRQIERRAEQQQAQKQQESDRQIVDQLGGSEFAIQMFYASPGAIRRGQSLQLCYGVTNAKTVTLQPQDNPVWPSHNRCFDVSPKKTTTYTLTITDAAGNTKSQTVEVKVS
jgi:hypothetical protein